MPKNYVVGLCPEWPARKKIPVLFHGTIGDIEDVLIVSKPPGMDSFNSYYHLSGYPQLYHAVQQKYPEYSHVHRIDRTTSGVHVFGTMGRGTGSLGKIKSEWAKGVTKTYLAVVDRDPKWTEIILTMDVTNHSGNSYITRPCTTTLTRRGDCVIEAELTKGGRNHQIRRALEAVGFPLVGDRLYGGKIAHRVLLHAWKWDLHGVTIQAPLPPDMAEYEPGGYTEPIDYIDVDPLSERDMERLAEFRRVNGKGAMPWPLPPDPEEAGVVYDGEEDYSLWV